MNVTTSLGEQIVADIERRLAATDWGRDPWSAVLTDDPDEWVDEDEVDSVVEIPVLTPIGEQTRPNGDVYHPRAVTDTVEDLALLRDARDCQEPVLLYGPPGTGKTAMCEAAFACDATSEHAGLECIVGTADTTEADFVGTFVPGREPGSFDWRPGPLHRAVLNNIPLLVDEIGLLDPRVVSVLYPLMDGRGVLTITANPDLPPIPVGKGFFVMGAWNPEAPGARMSEALRDRFAHHIEVGTDWHLAASLGVPEDIVDVARELDEQRREGDLTWSPQLRSLLAYAQTERRYGRPYALGNLLAKAPQDDRDAIGTALANIFGPVQPSRLGRRYTS